MKKPNDVPAANEFGQLRAYLARNGFKQADINAAIGQTPNGRSRAIIANSLKQWIKNKNGQ